MALGIKNTRFITNICQVRTALKSDFISMLAGPDSLEKIPVFNSAGFQDAYATPRSIILEIQENREAAGESYEQRVRFIYPGFDITNLRYLHQVRNEQYVLQLKLADSDKHLMIGNEFIGAELNWSWSNSSGVFELIFSLTDVEPPATDPVLDLFTINSNGFLVQNYAVADDFEIDANGFMVVTGPNEAKYQIIDGQLHLLP